MANYRSDIFTSGQQEPRIFGGAPYSIQTPLGTVPSSQAPPIPPRPYTSADQSYQSFQSYGGGGGYMPSLYGGGGYGGGYGMSGYSGYGGAGGMYGGYGRGAYGGFGGPQNPMDPEYRFVQMAEEFSRPTFQGIESFVGAIGNIAQMFDATFFALTSSFRAILGVASNFGQLRSVLAQIWSTFSLFRGITWLYRKVMYALNLSNIDPSQIVMNEAYAAAGGGFGQIPSQPRSSAWPIMIFVSFLLGAPYLISKLMGRVTSSAIAESSNPKTWVNPIKSVAIYEFKATQKHELSILVGQEVIVAPKEVQNTHKLLNTGWALASIDHQTSGLIPINYLQGPQQPVENRQSVAFNQNVQNIIESKQEIVNDTSVQAVVPKVSAVDSSLPTNEFIGPQVAPVVPTSARPTNRLFGDIPKLGSNNCPVIIEEPSSVTAVAD